MGIRAWVRKMRVKPPKDRRLNAVDVAMYFIARSQMEDGNRHRSDSWYDWERSQEHKPASLSFDIDSRRIQYLVYYAEVWNLALLGESLFEEAIEISGMDEMPFVMSVYFEFKPYSVFDRIPLRTACEERLFTTNQLEVLDAVWEVYGTRNRHYLSGSFHRELPYQQAKRQNKRVLSRETMRVYYKSRMKPKQKAE